MPYISIEFAGQKTFGGYLKIDNGPQISLRENLLIYIEPGSHYLSFSSETSVSRSISKLNVAVGNYKTAAWAERNSVDGDITETFYDNTLMLFSVVSDAKGHILSQPRYSMRSLDDEEMEKIQKIYEDQQKVIAEEINSGEQGIIAELILCLFLGGLGAHRFYRRKIGTGILYLFTFGLFGIGTLVDFISIIIRMVRK